jgi:hypothetical protein
MNTRGTVMAGGPEMFAKFALFAINGLARSSNS